MKEMRLNRLLGETIELLNGMNVPVKKQLINPMVEIKSGSTIQFGYCRKINSGFTTEKYTYTIGIASYMLSAEDEALKRLLIHELLHTLPNCMNHGRTWKQYAEYVSRKSRVTIKRTGCLADYGINIGSVENIGNYAVKCKKCGRITPRHKKSSLITNTARYRCNCGGGLERVK